MIQSITKYSWQHRSVAVRQQVAVKILSDEGLVQFLRKNVIKFIKKLCLPVLVYLKLNIIVI